MPANDLVTVTLCLSGKRHRREPSRVVGMIELVSDYGEERVIPAKRAGGGNDEDSVGSKPGFHRRQHRSGVVQVLDNVASDNRLELSRTVQVLWIFCVVADDIKTQASHPFYHWFVEIKADHLAASLVDSLV